MAIYELFNQEKNQQQSAQHEQELEKLVETPQEAIPMKDRFFSSVMTRGFFFFLLLAACVWALYASTLLVIGLIGSLLTVRKVNFFANILGKAFLMFKRCLICVLGLFVGLFSPSFGIVLACTYFLMYDKQGLEEVVPTSLQTQFKALFKEGEIS